MSGFRLEDGEASGGALAHRTFVQIFVNMLDSGSDHQVIKSRIAFLGLLAHRFLDHARRRKEQVWAQPEDPHAKFCSDSEETDASSESSSSEAEAADAEAEPDNVLAEVSAIHAEEV